jgi:hypothetical protein
MNKKGFSTSEFVISGLLFTGVIIFIVLAITGMQSNYSDGNYTNIVSEDFESTYNKLSQQTQSIDTMRNTSLSGEGLSFRGAFDVTFGSFFTVMQLVFGTLGLFGDMYVNLTTDFPFLDAMVVNQFFIIGLSILTVFLIFALINAVGRNKV